VERTYRRFAERLGLSRPAAGVAALGYPVLLMGVALASGSRSVGDLGEPAVSVLGALLFLIAAPTTWIFSIDFIDVSRFTALVAGGLTSLTLWYLVGSAITGGARTWSGWLNRYVVLASGWTFANLLLFGLIGAIVD
jgi:hypothetical protein